MSLWVQFRKWVKYGNLFFGTNDDKRRRTAHRATEWRLSIEPSRPHVPPMNMLPEGANACRCKMCSLTLAAFSHTHINRSCESQSPNETRSENQQNCQTKANAAMKRCLICFYSLWNLCEWHCVAVHMRWLSVHIKRIERKCPISQMSIASHDKWKSLFAFRISDPIGDRFAWMRRFR